MVVGRGWGLERREWGGRVRSTPTGKDLTLKMKAAVTSEVGSDEFRGGGCTEANLQEQSVAGAAPEDSSRWTKSWRLE